MRLDLRPRRPGSRILLVGAFVATSLLNYGFALGGGWLLSPGDFGVLAIAQTMVLMGGVVLEAGFPWALARVLADSPTLVGAARGVILSSLAGNLVLGCLMGAAVVTLFALGPLTNVLESFTNALLIALSLPLIAIITTGRGAAQGRGRFASVALIQVTEIGAKCVSGLSLLVAGLGLAGAVSGFTIGAATAAAVAARQLTEGFNPSKGAARIMPPVRAAAPILGCLLGIVLLMNLDLVILKLFSGTERELAGRYQAARVLANAPFFLSG